MTTQENVICVWSVGILLLFLGQGERHRAPACTTAPPDTVIELTVAVVPEWANLINVRFSRLLEVHFV